MSDTRIQLENYSDHANKYLKTLYTYSVDLLHSTQLQRSAENQS